VDEPRRESEPRAAQVSGRLTRRPTRRRRRFSFFGDGRLRGVGGVFDSPGLELAEVPIIGPIVLGIFLLLLLVVLVIFFGGFLIAFIELVILGLLAVAGWLWAWLRGHPKVAVLDVDDQRWVRDEGPAVGVPEDRRSIEEGADPAALGYRPLD